MALWASFAARARRVAALAVAMLAVGAGGALAQGLELPQAPIEIPGGGAVPQDPVGEVTKDPVGTVNDTAGRLPQAAAPPSSSGGGSSGGASGGTAAPRASPSPNQSGGGSNASGTPPRSGGSPSGANRSDRGAAGRDGPTGSRGRRTAPRAGSGRRAGRRATSRPGSTRPERPAPSQSTLPGPTPPEPDPSLRDAVGDIVEVVPLWMKIAVGVLALLTALLAVAYSRSGLRARRLARQRIELLRDIGLLQAALLPEVPARLGQVGVSVAYQPADGPGAGGDFYDAFALDDDRVAVIVGDVSGHGRKALGRTTLVHYTLRAYLEAGLEPRTALQLAGHALGDDLGDDFATVVVARWDSRSGTLSYASAGHPPPIVRGGLGHEPIATFASPPLGVGLPTGRRQTTIALPQESLACFFTDGLIEARIGDELVGRERLAELIAELGSNPTAQDLLGRLTGVADRTPDDMAVCVLSPDVTRSADPFWVEELELEGAEGRHPDLKRFLSACGLADIETDRAAGAAEAELQRVGGAILSVRHHAGALHWDVGARGVETLLHGTGTKAGPATATATPAVSG